MESELHVSRSHVFLLQFPLVLKVFMDSELHVSWTVCNIYAHVLSL